MISQEEILNIGNSILGKGYKCDLQSREYIHSKMGRSDEYQLDVNELIMSYKKYNHGFYSYRFYRTKDIMD